MGQLGLFEELSSPLSQAARAAPDNLPEVAREIESLIGFEAMVGFILRFGGTRLNFPRLAVNYAGSDVIARVADVVGEGAALKLAQRFGSGEAMSIPKCHAALLARRNRAICSAYDDGVSVTDLARRWALTERQVWRVLKATSTA